MIAEENEPHSEVVKARHSSLPPSCLEIEHVYFNNSASNLLSMVDPADLLALSDSLFEVNKIMIFSKD